VALRRKGHNKFSKSWAGRMEDDFDMENKRETSWQIKAMRIRNICECSILF
jgi:hypothetical protein